VGNRYRCPDHYLRLGPTAAIIRYVTSDLPRDLGMRFRWTAKPVGTHVFLGLIASPVLDTFSSFTDDSKPRRWPVPESVRLERT